MTQIDLTKILKYCPEGTKLYSPIFGKVTLVEIIQESEYPIRTKADDCSPRFTREGRYYKEYGECMLFPSKDNRDWRTFNVEQPQPKPQTQGFAPFQKVLVRDNEEDIWEPQIFSYYKKDANYPYVCIGSASIMCIHYEGNEALLGTADEPKGKED